MHAINLTCKKKFRWITIKHWGVWGPKKSRPRPVLEQNAYEKRGMEGWRLFCTEEEGKVRGPSGRCSRAFTNNPPRLPPFSNPQWWSGAFHCNGPPPPPPVLHFTPPPVSPSCGSATSHLPCSFCAPDPSFSFQWQSLTLPWRRRGKIRSTHFPKEAIWLNIWWGQISKPVHMVHPLAHFKLCYKTIYLNRAWCRFSVEPI